MKAKPVYLVLAVCLLIGIGACSKAGKKETQTDYKEFIDIKCTVCHFSKRHSEPRASDEWAKIVTRMHKMNPQLISKTDADKITKYLQENVSK